MKPTSALFFSVKDEEKAESIKKLLEKAEFSFTYNRYKEFMLNMIQKSSKQIQNYSKRFIILGLKK